MKKSNTIITDWLDKYGDPNIEKKVETKIFIEEIKRNKKINNLDKQYQQLLHDILDNGIQKSDRTGTGTLSVFGRQIRHKMSEGFPLITTKKMAFKTMVVELLWFLRGDTNIKYLVDNGCNIWNGDAYKTYERARTWELQDVPPMNEFIEKIKTDNNFAKVWGELGPIYGFQWRNWGSEIPFGEATSSLDVGIDQIAKLINDIKTNPDSRRLMVNAWNPSDLHKQILPPCHYGFQVYTRELNRLERIQLGLKAGWKPKGFIENFKHEDLEEFNIPTRAISLMFNMRSCDTFLGLPFNIASYGLLLETIAKEVNMIPDELIGNLGDTHLYSNHIEQAKEQISRKPYTLPQLKIAEDVVWKDGDCLPHYEPTDFVIENYQSHPTIKAPLSN